MGKQTYFFDALQGIRIAMNFDFGRAMRQRHEAELIAKPARRVGSDWASSTPSDNAPEAELPEGLSDFSGRFFADCCRCGRRCDVTEFIDEDGIDFTRWHGGCGPGCTP